ncbi:MAG TPA: diguanylate cyclase [Moraxellaceae bacterium]|nr:diguanylate cyclase [Moraxellaceae bacterium]
MMPHPAILVVDDQNSNLIAMEAVFEGEPVDLVKANSGAEALKIMLQRDFALVLLDVQMPDLDGFEVAEIMRSNPRTESTPIIFLTAISKEQRYIFRGYETGAVDYLFKPIDAAILRSKVRVFLDLERKNRSLRESLRLLQAERDHNQTLLRSLSEGLLGVTQSGNVFYANPTAEQMLGHSLRDLIGCRLSDFFHLCDEDGERANWSLAELMAACAAGERVHRDDLFLTRDGRQLAVEISANPLLGDDARAGVAGVVVVFRDVSSRRQNEKALARKATSDSLTGLCNRAEFERLLEEKVAEANRHETSLALLYIDLDRFKGINDGLGHHVGDQVLKAAAKRLVDSARNTDIVARIGGDEFVMVLESTEPRRAASLVSGKVLQQFARVVNIDDGSKLQVGTSVGIAIYPDDSTHAEDLLKCADKAMYQAKTAGRHTYRFFRG